MSETNSQERFRSLWENSGFWSCLGFEGLSIVFDVPVTSIQPLSEDQKKALMGLLSRLTKEEELRNQVQATENMVPEKRLRILLHLSSPPGA